MNRRNILKFLAGLPFLLASGVSHEFPKKRRRHHGDVAVSDERLYLDMVTDLSFDTETCVLTHSTRRIYYPPIGSRVVGGTSETTARGTA